MASAAGLCVGSAVPCGSASPVRYQSSAYRAARRFQCENRREPDFILQAARRAKPGVSNVSDRILQAARRAQPGVSNVSDRILQAARRAKPDVLFLFPHSLPGTLGAFLRSLCSRWLHLFLLVACVLTGCLRFWHLPAIFNVMASLPIPMGPAWVWEKSC